MTELVYTHPGIVHEIREGVEYAVENIPQRHPHPPLPRDKQNLLDLYGIRVIAVIEHPLGRHRPTEWVVYMTDDSARWRPHTKLLLLSDSIELWIAIIKDWRNPVLDPVADRGSLNLAPSKRSSKCRLPY